VTSNFKSHSRETISVSGRTFVVFLEESNGLYRAQAKVRWKNHAMGETPLLTGGFKDTQSAVKQITAELERLLRGGEIKPF